MRAELGNIRSANLLLLGFCTQFKEFPFSGEELRNALEAISSPGQRKANLEAFGNQAGADKAASIQDGVDKALEVIASGAARDKLAKFVECTNRFK